jgi:hypothetical protein
MTKTDKPIYPWAELYDLESGVTQIPQQHHGAGRPRKPINRVPTSITLTDEEKRIFEKLTYSMKMKLYPGKVTKNQVLGLALRLLDVKFEELPERVNSWASLADQFFSTET